jgi:hypothetical protein
MYKAVWMVCALVISTSASASEAPERKINDVRFNAFVIGPEKVGLVARGVAGQNATTLRTAFESYAKSLCSDARVVEPLVESEYEYLEGGSQITMPAGGILLSMTQYHNIKKASALSGSVECKLAVESLLPEPAVNVFVASDLGEAITYLDQGFASFNRERLDVPVAGTSLFDTLARSVSASLKARGYQPMMVDSADKADVIVTVSKAHVPQEQFAGMALLTKIGLLGITNLSAEFCSVVVSVQRKNYADQHYVSSVSTRKLIKPIYGNWAKDMAAGPAPDLHKKTSADLSTTLYDDVAAAIHRLPSFAFDNQATRKVAP